MSLATIQRRTWSRNILFSVMVELTYRCNLNCFYCYNDLGLAGTPLSDEQYFRLFDDLRAMEVLNLTFTGGEPLCHPSFFALGARARALGFVVRIKSNGHALGGKLARRIKEEVDPYSIDLSLHGASAATHDRQTRVPGSFARLLANLPELRALGLRLKLNCTLTRWNEEEVEAMCDLADSFGVPIGINPTVSPRDDGDLSPLDIAPSREGKRRLYRLLDERARRAAGRRAPPAALPVGRPADEDLPTPVDKSCGAGSSGLTVDPYGNVLPCVQWRRAVGNLHRRPIREIWERSTELGRIRRLTVEAKKVVDAHGPSGRLMDFCPGMAEAATGSPLAVYGAAEEQRQLLQELSESHEGRRRSALPIVS